MCPTLLEFPSRNLHLCFRCWFTIDQIAFRDQSWQSGQIPLRFSLTRFASSPEHTRRENRRRRSRPTRVLLDSAKIEGGQVAPGRAAREQFVMRASPDNKQLSQTDAEQLALPFIEAA